MSTKKERRSLSRPDAFQLKVREKLFILAESPGAIAATLGVIILLVAGYFGMQYYRSYQLEQLTNEISTIDIARTESQQKLQGEMQTLVMKQFETQRKIAKISSDKKATEAQKQEKKKLEAEVKKLSADLKGLQKESAIGFDKKYLDFFEKHPDSAEGIRAAVFSASYSIDKKTSKLLLKYS